MGWRDLIAQPNGKLCIKRLWLHIGYTTATYCVIYESIHDTLTWDILLVYLAIVAGSPVALKYIETKYGQPK